MPTDVKTLIQEGAELTDRALDALLPSAETVPASIHGAMRHSTFAGGKRLRPVLAMQAAVAVAGKLPEGIAQLGAALEMLHTYSLIHDDLPALDNDDLRRGKPTCHVAKRLRSSPEMLYRRGLLKYWQICRLRQRRSCRSCGWCRMRWAPWMA